MEKFILALDAGTTSSRSILFNTKGKITAISQYEFTQYFPHKGWVEHDPIEIWNTQLKSIKEVINKAKIKIEQIHSIGITNQRETTVIWDRKTGKPVYNAIVWQDRRTSDFCLELEKKGAKEIFYKKTGLVLDSYFSGTKIKWILDQNGIKSKANNGELAFGTIDSWLIWNLSKGKYHITDITNASRTLIYNIHDLNWDTELLNILEIPESLLPKVVSCSELIGNTDSDLLGKSIPISGIAGDQQASLFGQMCTNPGDIKNTYGTGCFCIMNTGSKPVSSKNKMLTTIGYQLNNKVTYALEGSIFIAGALIQWIRDQINLVNESPEIEDLALSVDDNGGITFIPALSGLGAPYWNPNATGAIFGITRGTKKGHIARAALEAIALRSRDIILEMQKDANTNFNSLKVDGGASNNNLLMQIQSNLLNKKVIRPKTTETTALGAAFFSGLATGFWEDIDSIKNIWEVDKEFNPSNDANNDSIINLWEKRITKVL